MAHWSAISISALDSRQRWFVKVEGSSPSPTTHGGVAQWQRQQTKPSVSTCNTPKLSIRHCHQIKRSGSAYCRSQAHFLPDPLARQNKNHGSVAQLVERQ